MHITYYAMHRHRCNTQRTLQVEQLIDEDERSDKDTVTLC